MDVLNKWGERMKLISLDELKKWRANYISSGKAHSFDDMTALNAFIENVESIWHTDDTPSDDRPVLCYGQKRTPYIARYREGYYWQKVYQNNDECTPVVWMEIPKP